MKVAVTINENYIYPLKVMLHSLFSTQKEPVTVFLIHTGILEDKVEMLKAFSNSYGALLTEIPVSGGLFEKAPVMQHFSKEMYYRLLCPWILPEEERVLYLDPDIIINDSLSDFYQMNLTDAVMAAGRDRPTGMDHRKRLKLKPDTVYFNSGVLLMDLRKMREEKSVQEIWELLRMWEEELLFPDQDLLNLMWEGKVKYVEDAFNLNVNILYLREYFLTKAQKRSVYKIMHYIGPHKPWNGGYRGGCYSFWASAEWQVNPSRRTLIGVRIILEPWRFVYGLYLFWKNHKWKK